MRAGRYSFLILAAFLISLAPSASAAPLFETNASFPTGQEPYNLAIGDLNADGKADVVTANEVGGSVSVLLGNGDGTLRANTDIPVGSFTHFVSIGDVNGDGRADLVVTSSNYPAEGSVSLLLGNGDGTFQAKVDYPSGTSFLALADLNRDGRQDVVTAFLDGVSVRLGQANGTLGARVDYATPNGLTVAVVDANGDSNPDLVAAGAAVSVFLGNGEGSFHPRTDYPRSARGVSANLISRLVRAPRVPAWKRSPKSPDQWGNGYYLGAGDVNADGTPDLAIVTGSAVFEGSVVSVLLGNPDGSYRTQVDTPVLDFPTAVVIGDVSGDGKADVVTSNDWTGSVSILIGNGDGTFPTRVDCGSDGFPLSVGIADMDGDEKPDLVTCNSPGSVSVLLGHADGTFQARRTYQIARQAFSVATADVDGDGNLDAVSANWDSWNVSVLFGNGDGTMQPRVDLPAVHSPRTAVLGDLNHDGRADIVIGDDDAGVVSTYLSRTGRTFSPRVDYSTPMSILSMALGDLNRDGNMDVVATNSELLSAFLGNGDGTFQARQDTPILSYGWVALGDMNGDLIPDAAVSQGSSVSILPGRGDGTFGPPVDLATGAGTLRPAIADLNRDGKEDLLVGKAPFGGTPVVSVSLGNGDGTFQTPADYPTESGIGLVVGDLNADGALDVAVSGSSVSVLLGRGDGTLATPQQSSVGRGASPIAIGDLNRDGMPEVLIANAAGNTLTILRNLGSGGATLTAGLVLNPATVNLANHQPYISAIIEPVGFSPADIDRASIRLAGSVLIAPKFGVVADTDGDGLPELQVKFRRSDVDPHLVLGVNHLELTGSTTGGQAFHGSCDLRCQSPNKGPKHVTFSPNPLNPRGTLSFSLDQGGPVRVQVFDRGGRLVRTLLDAPDVARGAHDVVFDGTGDRGNRVASGIYYYRIETPQGPLTGRVAIVK